MRGASTFSLGSIRVARLIPWGFQLCWVTVSRTRTFLKSLKAKGNAMFEQVRNLHSSGREHPLLQLQSGKVCDMLSFPVCTEFPTRQK